MVGVELTDVTLRDGLQMEQAAVTTEKKAELFRLLSLCGYSRLEVTGFSHPKWVPQFADSEALCGAILTSPSSVPLMAFVPNEKGLERCLKFPILWVSAFIAASETFNQKNVNASIADTLVGLKSMVQKTHAAQRKIRVYVSTVFGCPYEGDPNEAQLESLLEKVAALGPDEIALSDTIGVASPSRVKRVLNHFKSKYPLTQTALHLHNTYGIAVANAFAGLEMGVAKFDGATGGVGGCPYAKGASGNAASEELFYAFYRAGLVPAFPGTEVATALDYLRNEMGIRLPSHLAEIRSKGGRFYGVI